MFVGHSGAGKDVACRMLAELTRLRFVGTTSDFLAKYVAARLGVSVEEARRRRHRDRNVWHKVGNQIRRRDPGLLVRESLADAEITGGARGLGEIQAARREGLVGLVVWVANDRVPRGSTVGFAEAECDEVLDNHGSFDELRVGLLALARRAGLPLRE